MRSSGYYVEVLGSPFTCFDAKQYGKFSAHCSFNCTQVIVGVLCMYDMIMYFL